MRLLDFKDPFQKETNMRKQSIAMALMGLSTLAAADNSVTMYGVLDFGAVNQSSSSGGYGTLGTFQGSQQSIASGIAKDTRFGVRGQRDLGNGLTGLFELEAGFRLDDGNTNHNNGTQSGLFRRHSWVGLAGGFGTLLGGRLDGARYTFATKYDAFEGGTVANMASIQVHGTRADNAVLYLSPDFNGFKVAAAYTTQLIGQETAGNRNDLPLVAVFGTYDQGPLSLTLDFEQARQKNNNTDQYKINIWVAGGSYDFGFAKAFGYWESVKNNKADQLFNGTLGGWNALFDHRSWSLGTTVPVSENGKLRASYVRFEDKTSIDASCNKWGVGYVYNWSKELQFYTDFANIKNKTNGICSIAYNATGSSSIDSGGAGTPAGGYGTRGFDLGVTYSF